MTFYKNRRVNMKKYAKQICAILIAVTVFPNIHSTAYADSAYLGLVDYDELLSSESQQHIVSEVDELRSENEKHFLLSDGSYIAEKYINPIHFQEENIWYEIDNTPSLSVWNEAEAYCVDSGYTKKLFECKIKNNQLFQSSVGEKTATVSISNRIVGSCDLSADVEVISKSQSCVSYKKLLKSADVEFYNIGHDTIANIVLNRQSTDYSYTFSVTTNNLMLNPSVDGGFVLVDNEYAKIFEITKPYAIDSVGAITNDVTFDIVYKDGNANITLSAPKDWMNQYNREYPIRITSSLIYTSDSGSDISINHVAEGTPDAFSLNEHDVFAGYSPSSAVAETKTLIQVNKLPTIPDGATLQSAQLQLRLKSCATIQCPSANFSLSQVLGECTALKNVTWNNCPEHKTASVGNVELSDGTTGKLIYFNISDYVKSGNLESCTFIFHLKNPDWYYKQYAMEVCFDGKCTYSSPMIIFRYTLSEEEKVNMQYEKLSVGNFVTAYIGKTAEDSMVSCSIINIGADENRFEANLCYSLAKNNWRLSLYENINSYTTGSKEFLIHNDENGIEHIFTLQSGSENQYVTADSEDIIQQSSYDECVEYKLLKKDGTIKLFHNGYLQSETNSDGYTVLFAYNYPYNSDGIDWKATREKSANTLIQVLLVKPTWSEPEALINYKYENGNCTEIVNANGDVLIQYGYMDEDNLNLLTSIQISDHTTIELQYDKRGKLSRAIDHSKNEGIGITYSDLGAVCKVFEYTVDTSTNVPDPGKIISFTAE